MEAASTQSAFSLTAPATGQLVGGVFSWNADNTVMTFTPDVPLARETRYTTSISEVALTARVMPREA